MKKKHHHKKKGHRNNGAGGAGGGSHPRPRSRVLRLPRRGKPPDWKTVGAAVAGGAGGAALGGLIVNQNILSPEAVGLGLLLGGSATAYYADGITRVVGTGVAGAGAGQLMLSLMATVKSPANHNVAHAAPPQVTNQSGQPAAPPPPVEPPRRSATGGGVVLDHFRDATSDLDMIDDEFRFGMRDDPRDAAEPFVIDLDEAA